MEVSQHSLPYSFEFPTDWPIAQLGNVSDIKSGVTLGRTTSSLATRSLPYLRVANVQDGYLDLSEIKEILVTDAAAALFRLIPGDVLMIEGGDFDKLGRGTVWLGEITECLHQNHAFRVRVDQSRLLPSFLSAFSASDFGRRYFLISSKQTTNLASINSSQLKRFPLPIPPLPQQRKITRILTTLDNVITQTEALIAKYQAIKQGLMHDLFTRGVDATGKLRPPQSEASELYKQSELGWIPKEWEVVGPGEISHRMANGFVGIATPFYTDDDNALPYLYGNNVRPDNLELSSFLPVTRAFHEGHKKSQLETGDMLTVQSGHIGTSAIVPDGLGEANCHALIITKFGKAKAFSPFVSAYCNSPGGMARMASIFVGSTILHVNVKELKNFTIPLPVHLAEQKQIRSRVDSLSCSMSSEHATLTKLKRIKTGLMQDLLTGKVPVKADEPEEITP